MNITNGILRPVLRCTGLTVLWIAISASAQVLPSYAHRSGGVFRQIEQTAQAGAEELAIKINDKNQIVGAYEDSATFTFFGFIVSFK